jgi:hypothetical protein
MHRIRFSTLTQQSNFDTDDQIASAARQERLQSVGRKHRVPKDQTIVDQSISNGND